MKLTLHRKWLTGSSTIGELAVNGVLFCYTLEDTVRPAGVKIPKVTAIQAGTYKVIISYSNRFGKKMPEVLNVPMFEGIRIHAGGCSTDTEGCILVGKIKGDNCIHGSKAAFDSLFPLLCKAKSITLSIT